MKFNKFGIGIKFIAVILFLISLLAAFWSLLGIGYMVNDGYYENGNSFYKTEPCMRATNRYASAVFHSYFPLTQKAELSADERNTLSLYQAEFSDENTNFLFRIIDETGAVLLTNYTDQKAVYQSVQYFTDSSGDTVRNYQMYCIVRDPITAPDDYSQPYSIYKALYPIRYALIVTFAVFFLLTACLFIYLLYAAGRRGTGDEIVATWQHGVPLDLFAAGLLAVGYFTAEIVMTFNLRGNMSYGFLIMLPVSFIVLLFSFAVLIFSMNFAVQIKRGKWWRNTVIYRMLHTVFMILAKLLALLPTIWKVALLIAGYLFVNILLAAFALTMSHSPGGVAVWLLFNFAVFAALCFLLNQMKMIKRAGEQIVSGDYVRKIDTTRMLWDVKLHAENLNNVMSGMSKAVEERIKSERLKTELITNVSHDLKTPLTSIMNYIDLLKREPIANETARDHIAVLDRQSARLKKLTEDLLEASKAATGNLSVTLGRTDLGELINQSLGEYAERFEANRLEIVCQPHGDGAVVYADGRLLWRVFDNLFNNICKYSLAGTRVYIAADPTGDRQKITIRNISREPLNIAPDELLERFVRGDAARSTEGSGLGLSIARNLTELQGGTFELTIEGDLFKTVLTFKSLE
jgi:signal transduction histidine kinase